MVNPTLFVQEMAVDDQNEVKIISSILFVSILGLWIFSHCIGLQEAGNSNLRGRKVQRVSVFISLLLMELAPIPYISLFASSLACSEHQYEYLKGASKGLGRLRQDRPPNRPGKAPQLKSCSRFASHSSGQELFYKGQIIVFVMLIYAMKTLDFDQRIRSVTFGSR